MTAEIVVANKVAVALAADSTITIRSGNADKTYNTANKLFTLSKIHPVGALVYGAANLNSIPIEVIIKEYRHSLSNIEKDSLQDYAEEFLDFLRTSVPMSPKDNSNNYASVVYEYCRKLQIDVRQAIINRRINLSDSVAVRAVIREFVNDFRMRVHDAGPSPSMLGTDRQTLEAMYPSVVEKAVGASFSIFSLTPAIKRQLIGLIYEACLSNELTDNRLGMVIAGYGRKEYYPSLISYEMDGFVADKLKLVDKPLMSVSNENESLVYPFAQRDAATLFMEGVDPLYQDYMEGQITELITGIADVAGAFFNSADRRKIGALRRALANLAKGMIADFEDRRGTWFVSRTLDAVEFLDKSELAALAESLVSLTALRQKVSLDMETVGGPIDVAVISKGDGFIWIKRKYYFEAERNPFYFERYLR